MLPLLALKESLFLYITIKYFFQRAWIGLYFYSDNWKWSLSNTSLYKTGETEFSRWRPGQPDHYNHGQHCGVMNANSLWYDNNCEKAKRSACFDVRGENIIEVTKRNFPSVLILVLPVD